MRAARAAQATSEREASSSRAGKTLYSSVSSEIEGGRLKIESMATREFAEFELSLREQQVTTHESFLLSTVLALRHGYPPVYLSKDVL